MDFADSDDRPAKRRRFFSDPDDHLSSELHPSAPPSSSPPLPKPRFFQDAHDSCRSSDEVTTPSKPLAAAARRSPLSNKHVGDPSSLSPLPQGDVPPAQDQPASAVSFDQATFEAFVGDAVKPHVMETIRTNCGNSLERAVNMYFDGTWKNVKKPHGVKPFRNATPAAPSPQSTQLNGSRPVSPGLSARLMPSRMPETRYIGAFGVEGWATRSGSNLLKHGDVVKIDRQKIQPRQPAAAKGQTKLGLPVASARGAAAAAAKRIDNIVRFTNTGGSEIGRLAKETANWVTTLIDQKVCRFEGVCVYAPERLRTNETVFLQLRCFILSSAFDNQKFNMADNRNTGIFEQQETSEERDLRTRQVALVKLFQEVNLAPIRTNAAAAKHSRAGLLEAADMAEKKEKETARAKSRESPGSSPPADEPEEGQELEQDQLDSLYKKAQSFDFNTPEAEPADAFAMTLRPYQKQSLHWMLSKERDEKDNGREVSMHPLWEEYAWPTKDVDDKDLPQSGQAAFYVNPYSGELSLDFPVQEQHCLGGVLADEMGLGKTIQMLSLIHTNKSEVARQRRGVQSGVASVNNLPRFSSNGPTVLPAPCTTLVIAPMSLLAQWQSEAEKASEEGTLKSMVYYGSDKSADLQALCCEANAASAPDMIITSYGVVLSEFTQIANGKETRGTHRGIFSLNFFRVILDEAHTIKNRQSKTAKACYDISAEHRWVLTGTPIVNRLEDLFSLVRFLRVEPWNNFSYWRTFITVPFESGNFMRALDVVQTVLEPLVMRRTKDMRMPDGQPLVALPSKTIDIVEVELSKSERAVYDYIYQRAKRAFSANVEAGTVLKAYTSIFAQILRLRQTCCHPTLVRNQDVVADEEMAGAAADAAAGLGDDMDLDSLVETFTATTEDAKDANAFGAHVLRQIREEAANECPICAEEPMVEQTVTSCWHSACKKCILDYIMHQTDRHIAPRCVNCREIINIRDLFEVVRHDDETDGPSPTPRISLQRLGVNNSSAKVVALIKSLRDLRKSYPRMKTVVFSQFTSFMTLIESALARANMHFVRLDGSMSQKARTAVLNDFQESKKFTILLISLRAGGVGLNLTQAKRVYMMDPWWSFAVEAQAIDRVHRMGQEDEVKVYRFIVKDSVEERMLKVQDRKKFIATSLGMMTDEEKKLQRIEDIKELLS